MILHSAAPRSTSTGEHEYQHIKRELVRRWKRNLPKGVVWDKNGNGISIELYVSSETLFLWTPILNILSRGLHFYLLHQTNGRERSQLHNFISLGWLLSPTDCRYASLYYVHDALYLYWEMCMWALYEKPFKPPNWPSRGVLLITYSLALKVRYVGYLDLLVRYLMAPAILGVALRAYTVDR